MNYTLIIYRPYNVVNDMGYETEPTDSFHRVICSTEEYVIVKALADYLLEEFKNDFFKYKLPNYIFVILFNGKYDNIETSTIKGKALALYDKFRYDFLRSQEELKIKSQEESEKRKNEEAKLKLQALIEQYPEFCAKLGIKL